MPMPSLGLTTSLQTLVTGGASQTAITAISFLNFSGSAQTIDVHVVADGGSADNTNKILSGKSIPAGDAFVYDVKIILGANQTVQALASANTSVNSLVSYLDLA